MKWLKLWHILLVSVLLRVAAALYFGNVIVDLPGTFDQVSYHTLAARLVDGYGFTFGERWWPVTPANTPTAHWSYLYTLFVAGIYKLVGVNPLVVRLIQAVAVGILQPWLAYKIGRKLYTAQVGLIAAALTAGYIYFFYYAATLMTEPFYITAILGILYLLILARDADASDLNRLTMGLGLLVGSAILLRQLFLLVVPFLFIWMMWSRWQTRRDWGLKVTVGAALITILMIVPFTIFNYGQFGRFVLLNTNAGFAFFWGNHPIYGTQFHPILPPELGTYQGLIPAELWELGEAELENELLGRGLGYIAAEPGRYLRLSMSRIAPYFKFWPSAESSLISNISRTLSFGLALPFMLVGLGLTLGQATRRHLAAPTTLLLLFAVLYSLIHIFTWSLIRYRLPVDAVLLIFAAFAVQQLVVRWGISAEVDPAQINKSALSSLPR